MSNGPYSEAYILSLEGSIKAKDEEIQRLKQIVTRFADGMEKLFDHSSLIRYKAEVVQELNSVRAALDGGKS